MMQSAEATADHTLMVGDSGIDLETAQRAGTRCCLVAFGYGHQSVARDRLSARDSIVDDAAAWPP
jgi:phosphoglycolate phosphatase-like HAD superfamily hydrolase